MLSAASQTQLHQTLKSIFSRTPLSTTQGETIEIANNSQTNTYPHMHKANACHTNGLIFLPTELWINIFHKLSDCDRWNLARVSPRLYSIFKQDVGVDHLVVVRNLLHPLPGVHDPAADHGQAVQSDHYAIKTLHDLRIVRYAEEERYMLHWKGSLTCLILYHPTASASLEAEYVWQKYFQQEGLRIGEEQYYVNGIPPWVRTGRQVLAVIPLVPSHEFLSHFVRYQMHQSTPYLRFSFTWDPHQQTVHSKLNLFCKPVNQTILRQEQLPDAIRLCIMNMMHDEIRQQGIHMQWNAPSMTLVHRTAEVSSPSRPLSLPLFDYQRRALAWMTGIEQAGCFRSVPFRPVVPSAGFPSLNFYLQVRLSQSYFTSPVDFHPLSEPSLLGDASDSFRLRGGIFADEIGLGKTMTILALLLTQPRTCQQAAPLHRSAALFETKSSLIICPSHIVPHWRTQLATFASSLRCLEITIMSQLRSISYQDILDSDVVLVSQQLLKNKTYLKKIGKLSTIFSRGRNKKPLPTNQRSPILQHFGWHRIILDEAHEMLSKPLRSTTFSAYEACGRELFDSFLSNYRWCVSGTPLLHGRASLVGALHFLQLTIKSGLQLPAKVEVNDPVLAYEWALFAAIRQHFYWRHTKHSVSDQLPLAPLQQRVHLTRLSPMEQSMYDAVVLERKVNPRAICTLPRTLMAAGDDDQIVHAHTRMTCQYYHELANVWQQLVRCRQSLTRLERELLGHLQFMMTLDPQTDTYYQNLHQAGRWKVSMSTLQNSVQCLEPQIIRLICQTACLARSSMQQRASQCSTCVQTFQALLVEHPERAADEMAHAAERCPVCAAVLSEAAARYVTGVIQRINTSSLAHLQDERSSFFRTGAGNNVSSMDSQFQYWQGIHGTKLASVLCYVREILEANSSERIVIFSQQEVLLEELAHVFRVEEDYRIVVVNQALNSRRRAAELFGDSKRPPHVLLMSLDYASSRARIIDATHILLLDPVADQPGASSDEEQAIARVHRLGQSNCVTTVRFVTRATVEQEDYERAFGPLQQRLAVSTF